jgi:glucan-binding YG repeat protein
MKLKAVKIIFTVLIASVLSTGIIALPVQNAFAEDSVQIENSVTESSDIAVPYMNSVGQNKGTWIKESNGRWWYKHKDGSYTKYDWEYIDGSWYFFDKNGWMWTEWLKWEGNWYYLNPSGVMHTGWLKDDGKWYYFTMRGIMQTGWIKLDADWYYLGTDGVMQTGWLKLNSDWYYLNADGTMRKDNLIEKKRCYYFDSSGKLFKTEILIQRQAQEKSNWCWAACSAMVGKYYTNSSITQSDIVKFIKGDTYNRSGQPEEIVDAIRYASKNTKNPKFISEYLNYSEVVEKIDENHPFVIGVRRDINGYKIGGHAIVCAGYDKLHSTVRIIDPWGLTETKYYAYFDILHNYEFGSYIYKCSEMIIY